MKIAKHAVVSVHYKLTDDEGAELDSSIGQEPLVYLHGAKNLIPGLEKEMEGKAAGDAFQVSIQPEDAYGVHDPQLVQTVPMAMFKDVGQVQPGMVFQAQAPDGSTQRIVIAGVKGDDVQIDGNHPLAGKVLHFDIQVVDVRQATTQEITHGHAHGAHGHDH